MKADEFEVGAIMHINYYIPKSNYPRARADQSAP